MARSPMVRINRCTRFPLPLQLGPHTPRPVERGLQVLPVHGLHQEQVLLRGSLDR